jgi:hypothetical protein
MNCDSDFLEMWLQGRSPAFSGAAEGEHRLDVPSHGRQAPFAACLVEATQQELAESERRPAWR